MLNITKNVAKASDAIIAQNYPNSPGAFPLLFSALVTYGPYSSNKERVMMHNENVAFIFLFRLCAYEFF